MICRLFLICVLLVLYACSGSNNETALTSAPNATAKLTIDDVKKLVVQAVTEAKAYNVNATIAVADRSGNILAVYRMTNAETTLRLSTNPNGFGIDGGLEELQIPTADTLGAISKAVTGAYLSTSGNAFTTRTASQIVQEHFNPLEINQAAGPLFGVQFSQLACSDFSQRYTSNASSLGPQRSPLGLSADPGGLPLYKGGQAVGGIGIIADGLYSIDRDLSDIDFDIDEALAIAASSGFQAPLDIRANRITVDGKTLRFTDVTNSSIRSEPQTAADFDQLTLADGALQTVIGYQDGQLREGIEFGTPASGVRAANTLFNTDNGYILVDANNVNRFPPVAGAQDPNLTVAPLTANEVTVILQEALKIVNRSRAQIRQPLNSVARVSIAVVDTLGNVSGHVQSEDAPQFGVEVAVQKARTAAFFSSTTAESFYTSANLPAAAYLNPDLSVKRFEPLGQYLTAIRQFSGNDEALADGTAFSDRAGGNLSRPFFPDGINGSPNGPFSKPLGQWSVFSTGQQLDLVLNGILQHVLFAIGSIPNDVGDSCTGVSLPAVLTQDLNNINTLSDRRIANGVQIFPGSVPIYRGDVLVGGIGVSGDGVDQDDMISFLGVHNAAIKLGTINNAQINQRADQLRINGTRLRFIQCPFSPFLDSNVQQVCENL